MRVRGCAPGNEIPAVKESFPHKTQRGPDNQGQSEKLAFLNCADGWLRKHGVPLMGTEARALAREPVSSFPGRDE